MTSNRVRWGRLKLAHSASDDDAMVDSPAKSSKPTRFRRKTDDDAYGPRNGINHSELAGGGTSQQARRRRSRFRRESIEEGVPNNENRNKKGLFARQREKIREKKKKKRPPPKASGIKSDGDSADDESEVQDCYRPHPQFEMDDGSVDDHGASRDCNYNSDNYQSDNYHSDTQLTTLNRSPLRKRVPADLRRQQFQEQQLALEIQRQSMRVIELADDSSDSSVDSKPVASDRVGPSLDARTTTKLGMEPPRKKVSFGEPASTKENLPWASQPLLLESSTNIPLPPVRAHTTDDVDDVSDSIDLSSIDYNSPENAGPPSPIRALQHPIPRRMSRERARYSVHHGSIKKRFRVRPYHCFPNPVSMTEEEIYSDSLKTSDNFVRLKSYLAPTSKSVRRTEVPDIIRERWGAPDEDGRIGALRVEVLGCVSLNRTKPDVSVYLVCGDVAFCTDALDGYRSPMWPSASRRACIFPLHHAYAKLYVGVFDVRKNKSKENDIFCGRIVIDIASIRPNTEYDTTLPLRASSFVYDKRKRGVIRIRFSLHWFSERAAVMSYFKSVKSLVDSCPLVEGQPAIPCADPKTFRNVAVTVYGQDLPGKYSRNAFRATMREFNLYQQNLRLVVKVLVTDVMLYEKPWMSLYLFGAAMYCVLLSSVRMVPAFVFGYILILYIENYRHFVANKDFHLGYQPLTILEIGKALILNSDHKERSKAFFFEPANVEKLVRKRQNRAGQRLRRLVSHEDVENSTSADEANEGEITKMDHREFPFSERDAYPRFSVEDALAPGSNKADTGRLHGRLSVYYTPAAQPVDTGSGDEDPDSVEDSERDDETVMTESQMLSDNMFDLESDGDEDENCIEGVDSDYKRAMILQKGNAIEKRRIRLGPPQDSDVIGRKVPPQLQLKKVENMLNKVSKGVAVELVHAPPAVRVSKSEMLSTSETGMTAPSADLQMKMNKKSKKIAFDDFDKLLGLQSKSGNPIHRIMSSFMGPLMRMIRVGVLIIRLSFNIGTWRDPYLSFWVLVGLSVICLILIVFPWRSFFGLLSLICLGPQNIYVRRYLEKKAADAAEKAMMDDSETTHSDKPLYETSNENKISTDASKKPNAKDVGRPTSTGPEESIRSKSDSKKGFFSKFRSTKSLKVDSKVVAMSQESIREHETEHDNEPSHERPAFSSLLHGGTSSRKIEPRAVAIPYTRLKKDRFYDWPPDPTVSRATAIDIYPESIDDIDSLTASVPDLPMPDQEDTAPTSLRRRHVPDRGIPTSVSF